MALVVLAYAAAILGIVDLLTAIASGAGAIVLPVLGLILGWRARQGDAPRTAAAGAIGANAAALVVVVVSIFLFGGS